MRAALVLLVVMGMTGRAWADTCNGTAPCCDRDGDPGNGTLGASEQACVDALLQFGSDKVSRDIFRTSDAVPLKARDLDNGGRLARVISTNYTSCRGGLTQDGNAVNGIGYTCDYAAFWQCAGAGAGSAACAPPGGAPRDAAYEGHYNGEHVDGAWLQALRPGITGDGDATHFNPAAGLLFDLLGASNKVAVFAVTDHGPFPCESFEYEVFVTDDLNATEIADPAQGCSGLVDSAGNSTAGTPACTPGVSNPHKWNRTVLYKAFLGGWNDDRLPDGGPRFDLDAGVDYVGDGYTMVFSLPCGATFRYASLVPGNAGNPAPACAFYSSEYELDAVAGLNQDESSVCGDADRDGFPSCACAPEGVLCDCDDTRPDIHPGVPEGCGSAEDVGCLGSLPRCGAGQDCVTGACVARCTRDGECPAGDTCQGGHCLGSACSGVGCSAAEVCLSGSCEDLCAGAVCPPGQSCQLGACVDACQGKLCPSGQVCEAGVCKPGCTCVENACAPGSSCQPADGTCQVDVCAGVVCGPGDTCASGACVAICDLTVCPLGRTCQAGQCIFDPCFNVVCPAGDRCVAGACLDACAQAGQPCGPGRVCTTGTCTYPDGGVPVATTSSSSSASSGSSGTASSGTASSGTASSGTASSGTASSGTASSGTASSGTTRGSSSASGSTGQASTGAATAATGSSASGASGSGSTGRSSSTASSGAGSTASSTVGTTAGSTASSASGSSGSPTSSGTGSTGHATSTTGALSSSGTHGTSGASTGAYSGSSGGTAGTAGNSKAAASCGCSGTGDASSLAGLLGLAALARRRRVR